MARRPSTGQFSHKLEFAQTFNGRKLSDVPTRSGDDDHGGPLGKAQHLKMSGHMM